MSLRVLASLALLALSPLPLAAQYPANANALRWEGNTSQGGPFCWGFNCRPDPVSVLPGEPGLLRVRGELGQPFLVALSMSSSGCRSFSGFDNGLILDLPFEVFWSGNLTVGSPILACPSGAAELGLVVPTSLAPRTRFYIQGVVGVAGGASPWAFTQGLAVTVL